MRAVASARDTAVRAELLTGIEGVSSRAGGAAVSVTSGRLSADPAKELRS
jgi:hypothetical protein